MVLVRWPPGDPRGLGLAPPASAVPGHPNPAPGEPRPRSGPFRRHDGGSLAGSRPALLRRSAHRPLHARVPRERGALDTDPRSGRAHRHGALGRDAGGDPLAEDALLDPFAPGAPRGTADTARRGCATLPLASALVQRLGAVGAS